MVNISNADRDKAVEFLRAYVALVREHGARSTKEYNQQLLGKHPRQEAGAEEDGDQPLNKIAIPKSDYNTIIGAITERPKMTDTINIHSADGWESRKTSRRTCNARLALPAELLIKQR